MGSANDIDLNQLLDTWYLMRIISLAPSLISKQRPQVSFAFFHAWNLCNQFLYARDAATITQLVTGKRVESFNFLSDISKQLSLNVNAGEFSKTLKILDRSAGIFILAHWLTYIFDYQERADYVWAHFPLFYSMAGELCLGRDADALKKAFIAADRLMDPWTGQRFIHRFYKAHKLDEVLSRTVERLCEYEGSLTVYIDEKLGNYSCVERDNWIRLFAAALNALTYERYKIKEDLYHYAKEEHFLFPQNIEPWKLKVGGEKRLWSALRDYIVDPYFRLLLIDGLGVNNPARLYLKSLNESLAKNEMHLNQLELPGDVWNEEFRTSHLEKLREKKPESFKRIIIKNSRISARRFFHWLHQQNEYSNRVSEEKLFPVYLDVTFNLRRSDLNLLINKSNEIKLNIKSEIGDLKTGEDIIKAYDVLRRGLSEEVSWVK